MDKHDQPELKSRSGTCDGLVHDVSPARVLELKEQADAFNQLLRINEVDQHGPNHENAASAAEKAFYKYSDDPAKPTVFNEDRAFEASKAFYVQLSRMEVGERKKLADIVQEQNNSMAATDPAMPRLDITMDHSAFIDDMTVHYPLPFSRDASGHAKDYVAELFTFHYLGMCAEKPPKPSVPDHVESGWTIELPILNFWHH